MATSMDKQSDEIRQLHERIDELAHLLAKLAPTVFAANFGVAKLMLEPSNINAAHEFSAQAEPIISMASQKYSAKIPGSYMSIDAKSAVNDVLPASLRKNP